MERMSIQRYSSSSTTQKYDVFVSFRGEDTRNNFTDHLFGAFQRKGIVAFRDDTNLKQGEHISTKLIQAIEGSQVLIVVFSKSYATSSWCLQELAKVVDCMNMKVPTRQSVLPIFYDVSPSEVRKQDGDYGKALAKHEERFKQDLAMVQSWREALVQVANLSGWDVQHKPQYIEIEKIVERVINILGYKLSSLDGLVGMHTRVEHLETLLDLDSNDDVRVVGICGMGGIGKTTLARAVYDRNFHRYGATCLIGDISRVYHECGPIGVQKQLICQTLNEKTQDIWDLSKATYLLKTRLRHLKAFIVLDNVEKDEQLEELGVNREYLCTGSRIIIISRDKHILKNYGVDEVYDAQLLNNDEAHQLFCKKAFKCDYIMSSEDTSREYEALTILALEYAQCLPLAIKVLGSFLYGKSISEWRSALERLRHNPNTDIMDVLLISFDGLEPIEKEIFLDIACFFNYCSEDYVKEVLDCCGFYPDIGLRVLIDKSLIIVNSDSRIVMHDKLEELAMKIVQQKAPNEPGKWSRLWLGEDFCNVMYEKMAMDNLEAIRLSSLLNVEEGMTLRAEVLSKMNRLRFLILEDVDFSGSLNGLSKELRYLEWKGYPFTYFPSSCELTKLVELILRDSNIKELWEGIKPMCSLKIMDLGGSKNLVKTPDFSGIPNLERLDLAGCTKLMHIHPSIGLTKKLVYLNLGNCTSLMSFPKSIFGISSLEVLILDGCSKIFHSQLVENVRRDISDTAIQWRQSTSSIFKRLKLMLPFHFFNSTRHNDTVGSVMPSLPGLHCLHLLDLSFCNLLYIPDTIASLHCLERLVLRGNNFVTLPCTIKELPRLICLNLDNCKHLTSVPELPLRTVLPVGKEALRWTDDAGLRMFNCPKLVERESWSIIALSWMMQLLKEHKEHTPPISIVIPGTQIPSWFNRQNVGGSLGIEPNVRDSNCIGLAFCAAVVAQYKPRRSSCSAQRRLIVCWIKGKGEQVMWGRTLAEIVEMDEVAVELVHLFLLYISHQELIHFEDNIKDTLDLGDFLFKFTPFFPKDFSLEVKNFGMRSIFKQDLEKLDGDE